MSYRDCPKCSNEIVVGQPCPYCDPALAATAVPPDGRAAGVQSGSHLCTSCGSQMYPKLFTKGSGRMELILWLCLLVPGLIYSTWRFTTKGFVCRACGQPTIIPADSPMAKATLAQMRARLP